LVLVVLLRILRWLILDFIDNCLSLFISFLLLYFLDPLSFAKTFGNIWFHIDLKRELKILVDLDSDHLVIVELEAFERQHHETRQALDTLSLESINFLVTLFTVICVFSLKHLSLHCSQESLLERFLVLNWDLDSKEVFRAVILMRTTFTYHLICILATEVLLDSILLG